MHGKAVGVFPLSECPKLALNPGQVLSEYLGRSGGHRAARLVELGAKRPDRAAALCQEILVLEDVLDAGAKPISRKFVPRARRKREAERVRDRRELISIAAGADRTNQTA